MERNIQNEFNRRRSFLKKAAFGSSMLAGTNYYTLSAKEIFSKEVLKEMAPWYRNITRWGQVNISGIDPERYDIPC